MTIITIGDLHGSPVWKTINPDEWDRMIFIGDYVDSVKFGEDAIVQNLEDLISLKKQYPAKVILLWGNHDLAYLFGGHKRHLASGFRPKLLPVYHNLFTTNRELFQAAYGVGNCLWTHAGVVQEWFDNHISNRVEPSDKNLAFALNRLYGEYYQPLFNIGLMRGGSDATGGIFWADKNELEDDPLMGWHQVVGHNKTRSGIRVSNHFGHDTSVTWVNCLDSQTEFLKMV